MPHTQRKKRNQFNKRQEVVDDNGWTQVSRAPNAAAARRAVAANSSNPTIKQDPHLNLTKLKDELESYLGRWRDSRCRLAISTILKKHAHGQPAGVTKAICLAIGALSQESRRRSMWQFAAFIDMCDILGEIQGVKIERAVQEPKLLPLDIDLLDSMGMKVLSGDAALHLMSGAFVFMPYLEKREEVPYALKADQTLIYVSTGLDSIIDSIDGNDRQAADYEDSQVKMRSSHDTIPFPDFELEDHVLDLTMYLVKPVDGSVDVPV